MIKYNSVVEAINIGDLDFRMTLYEADASFESQPGQLTKVLNLYNKVYVVSLISRAA